MVHTICRPSDRITTLDVLQGLVLLGLLIAQAFGSLAFPHPVHPLPPDHHPAELPVQFLVQLLVSGQFDRLGSFLFGLGVYRCWQHGELSGPGLDGPGLDTHRIVRRLLVGLLGIGLSLSLLLGTADLLAQYALLGFSLLYLKQQSVGSLLCWMVALALVAIVLPSSLGLLHSAQVTRQTPRFSPYLSYELMMLGGWLLGKLGLSYHEPRLRVRLSLLQLGLLPAAFLLKGMWVSLALGLVAVPPSHVRYQPLLLALSGFLGPVLLSGVYLLDVGLNVRLTAWGWARGLGWVGQLSVTNYVLQSILCHLLLLGSGLAVSGTLPVWGRVGIVVSIYGVQISFSYIWRKRYRLGPLELVCHQWIYGKPGPSNSVTTARL